MSNWAWLCLMAAGCGPVVTNPAPPAHPGPSFVLTSAPSSPGTVFFHFDEQSRLAGRLELPADLSATHPLRLAVLWSASFDGPAAPPQTLGPTLHGRAGTQAFETPVAPPAEQFVSVLTDVPCAAGRFASSHGQLVVFVDANENGELDRFEAEAIDQVLGASRFQTELFGFQPGDQTVIAYQEACGQVTMSAGGMPTDGVRGEVKFRLFDDPRMNLVACNAAEVFTAQTACGIQVVQTPTVRFNASSGGTEARISVAGAGDLEVFVDDEPQGVVSGGELNAGSERWLTGEHRVRVESAGLRPWEARVRWPQPLVVLERPALLTEGQSYGFSWSTQPGVKFYWFTFDQGHGRGSSQPTGGSVSYTQEGLGFNQTQNHFTVTAQFTDFPGATSVEFEIPVRAAN